MSNQMDKIKELIAHRRIFSSAEEEAKNRAGELTTQLRVLMQGIRGRIKSREDLQQVTAFVVPWVITPSGAAIRFRAEPLVSTNAVIRMHNLYYDEESAQTASRKRMKGLTDE